MNLRDWGWDEGWEDAFAGHADSGLAPARVVRQDRGAWEIQAAEGGRAAEATGRFRRAVEEGEEPQPAVGDWVAVDWRPGHDRAGIEGVLPRRARLSREDAGRATREQVLAANVDVVFLVCALGEGRGFNLRRLERSLAMVRAGGAEAAVVLNKIDLDSEWGERLRDAEQLAPGVRAMATSATEGIGLELISAALSGGRTGALLGPSGSGKSELTNALLGERRQETRSVRASDARGRHATTRRELFRLPCGGLLIDTAGLREYQPWAAEGELEGVFGDVAELAARCRFRDCRHEGEPGCAVQEALGEGGLEWTRFEHYLRLRREQAYQETRRSTTANRAEKEKWKKISKMQKAQRRDW